MKYLYDMFELVIGFVVLGIWIFGFVLAKGFWPTIFCIIPFYSYYVVGEYFWKLYGSP